MSSACVIDLDTLLARIAGDNPCGVPLRWEPVYDQIKNARTSEEDVLGGETGGAEEVNWGEVARLAIGALTERSKDLMIAAWLTEALLASYGFAGVRDGLRLLHGLLTHYWDEVFPLPDAGDLEPRVAPLVWLMDADRGARLPNRLREIPFFPDSKTSFSWIYWKSRYTPPKGDDESDDGFARRKAEAEERQRLFEEASSSASLEYVTTLCEDIHEVKTALSDLDAVVSARFGDLAPGVTAFRQALEECEVLVRRIVRDKGGRAGGPVEMQEETAGVTDAGKDGQPANTASGPITSREDAFRRLAEVASYLRRAEPQSPVPLLIDRAISWGRMPFDQLLREMIKDAGSQDQVRDLLGIKGPDNEQ
ncbi:MAG: type VI secretion system protein TssA [Pirellulaceae bacterium]